MFPFTILDEIIKVNATCHDTTGTRPTSGSVTRQSLTRSKFNSYKHTTCGINHKPGCLRSLLVLNATSNKNIHDLRVVGHNYNSHLG